MLSRVKRFALDIDDKVQGFARKVYGANDPGKYDIDTLRGKIASLGEIVHKDAKEMEPMLPGILATRGLQAGGLTAAGYGLMKLTEQFGSAADQQEPGQLSLTDS